MTRYELIKDMTMDEMVTFLRDIIDECNDCGQAMARGMSLAGCKNICHREIAWLGEELDENGLFKKAI